MRRSGKSTICHKVLLEHGIRYSYVNLDDDRLLGMEAKDLNTVLSCIYQLYGTDVPCLFLDEIRLYPFSFSEYCAYHGLDTAGITTKAEASRKSAFMDYIVTGGFPELQNLRNKRGVY